MSTAPGETFTNPLDLKDRIGEYCSDVLAKTVREMKCHSGWLALLDEDGVSPTQVFANIRKQSIRILPPRLEQAWTVAVQVGLARIMSNFNPFTRRVLVPYYSGDKPVLLYILAGRLRPFNADDIARIASLGKDTWGELERIRYISQLEQAYEMTIQGWAHSLEERDRTSVPGHYHLPVEWAIDLARALHLNETSIGHLRRGAVLHDIGTMSIPESILQKSGTLSPEEWAIVRRHPILGAEMVAGTLFLSAARDVILYHHERWDGKGYPHGLRGEEIPLLARIFSVVDVFDALIVDRPYSPAWPRDMALAYIRQEAGQQFDPVVVDAFIAIAKSLRMK